MKHLAPILVWAFGMCMVPLEAQLLVFDGDRVVFEPPPPPPQDPRFFGTYCLPEPIRRCKEVPILRDPCVTIDNVRARVDHFSSLHGGLITGGGSFTADGKPLGFSLAGRVLGLGRIHLSINVPRAGQQSGEARLSEDGLELSIEAFGETFRFRKDACGNQAPTVSVEFPSVLQFGVPATFVGRITQDEDDFFPQERMAFESDRDGFLTANRFASARQLTIQTGSLSPGNHRMTFRATDSGGLTGTASVDVVVRNQEPEKPIIGFPRETDVVVAGGEIFLAGGATDPEKGPLDGRSLVWLVSEDGGPFEVLGSGPRIRAIFPRVGKYVVRLAAVDGSGAMTVEDRTVTVQPSGGNTAPRVAIEMPNPHRATGPVHASFFAGPVELRALAEDSETRLEDLELKWEFEEIEFRGKIAYPVSGARNPAPIENSLLAQLRLSSEKDTVYRVTFSAHDGEFQTKDSIVIMVLSAR